MSRLTILPSFLCPRSIRRASSSLASLSTDLPARRLPPLHDYMSPQPSYLLSTTLSSFLAQSSPLAHPPSQLPTTNPHNAAGHHAAPTYLPEGHHLIYFPPPLSLPSLLPDGTDPAHSPGDPFTRRMWAGGRVNFRPGPRAKRLRLDGRRAVCVEGIRDVRVKPGRNSNIASAGEAGNEEKVFVGIERRIVGGIEDEAAALGIGDEGWRARLWGDKGEIGEGEAQVVERRELVFMRDHARQQTKEMKPDRIVKAPHPATLTHTLTPTPHLLFRFSALTFNAHAIHLDKTYCRTIEGHRNLLVHGPLSLVFFLSLLRDYLLTAKPRARTTSSASPDEHESTWMIREMEYRNLAPLYAEEEMTLCARPQLQKEQQRNPQQERQRTNPGEDGDGEETWDVWIEGPHGGMCVRGKAVLGTV